MTLFWILAGGVTLFALISVLSGLRVSRMDPANERRTAATLYRDQLDEAEREVDAGLTDNAGLGLQRREIEERLHEERQSERGVTGKRRASAHIAWLPALVLVVLVPVGAFAMYSAIGQPGALTAEVIANDATHGVGGSDIRAMVNRLESRLTSEGGNAENWSMLGRSLTILGQYEKAAGAFARAVEQQPDNPALLADYADTLAMSRGRQLDGEPMRLVERALRIDPGQVKALALAGTAALRAGDPESALVHWRRLLADESVQGSLRESISRGVGQAEAQMAQGSAKAPAVSSVRVGAESVAQAAPATPAALSGEVRLDPALAENLSEGSTVYVFARPADGPAMPLAVSRQMGGEFPFRFKLDDSMAIAPMRALSRFGRVIVGARISKSGSATRSSGDLEGFSGVVANDSDNVIVHINTVVP